MKILNTFFLLIGCILAIEAAQNPQNPLDAKISSYYTPEMKAAFKKQDPDRVINLCKLDPKLVPLLRNIVKTDNSEWGWAILNKIEAIQKERSSRIEKLSGIEAEKIAGLQRGHKIVHGPSTGVPSNTIARARL
jgi:hypothetical protein